MSKESPLHGTVPAHGGTALLVAAILAFGGVALVSFHADAYEFIISGYPAANVSYASASTGTALATSTRNGGSAASPIEARYRTWDESDGIALRSDHCGMLLIFR